MAKAKVDWMVLRGALGVFALCAAVAGAIIAVSFLFRDQMYKRYQLSQVRFSDASRRYGVEEGTELKCPTFEFSYKEDALGDPLINDYHAIALGLATEEDIKIIRDYTFRINELMKNFFLSLKIELIDFKLEFGRYKDKIILADEISPDTCRLWEVGTGQKLDKDRFRRDLGNIEDAYKEVLSRVSK